MELNEQNKIYVDSNAYIQNWSVNNTSPNSKINNSSSNLKQNNLFPNANVNNSSSNFTQNIYPQFLPFDNKNLKSQKMCSPKKVVFQQPYESVPNFYLNNNFIKGNCNCVPKPKPKPKCPPQNFGFNLDFKNLLPLLSGLFKGVGTGSFGNLISMLNNSNNENEKDNSNLDFSSLIKAFSSSGGLSNILNLFKPKQSQNIKNEIKSTDFEIKNYTRVE